MRDLFANRTKKKLKRSMNGMLSVLSVMRVIAVFAFGFIFLFFVVNSIWKQPCIHPAPLSGVQKLKSSNNCVAMKYKRSSDKISTEDSRIKIQEEAFAKIGFPHMIDFSGSKNVEEMNNTIDHGRMAIKNSKFSRAEEILQETTGGGSHSSLMPLSQESAILKKIQEGLKAFGSPSISISGRMDSVTREAIIEFQELFGLPKTGNPDFRVYQKMKEEKFID